MQTETLPLFGERKAYVTPPKRTPRYYQREAVDAINSAFARGLKSVLVVMATGMGKTFTFCEQAREELKNPKGRVLILVHRKELLAQAHEALETALRMPVGIEQGDRRSGNQRVVVASVQTIYRDHRLQRFDHWGKPTLIIADEAHHGGAPTWRKVREHWVDSKFLGVTATSDALIGKDLFEEVVYEMQIDRGVEEGWLVPLMRQSVHLEQIDLSGVGSQGGDLKAGQLDEAIIRAVEGICKTTLELYPGHCGPIFLPGKKSAELACARLNALKPHCARVLTDDTDPDDRKRLIADVKAGRVQYLCNVQVATEGFDWPAANLVVLGRPTKSRTLYAQMVGRGTRTATGTVDHLSEREQTDERLRLIESSSKPHCVILDYVGNSGKHQLVSLTDLFGEGYSAKERKLAKELEAKASTKNDGAKEARAFLEQARAQMAAMAAKIQSKVQAKKGMLEMMGFHAPSGGGASNPFRPSTADQLAQLQRAGWPEPEKLSEDQARAAIRHLRHRQAQKLATLKQLTTLKKNLGWTDVSIPFAAATQLITALADNGWRRLTQQQIDSVLISAGYTGAKPQ